MTQIDQVLGFLEKNNGQITRNDLKEMGISSRILSRMVTQGRLERLAPGVYIDPAVFGDDLAALQYRLSKGVYFKSTALFLHGMIDRTPDTYEMNFPLPYSNSKKFDIPVKIYRQTKKLYEIGIEEVVSPGGHLVKTYNVERTLCDILRAPYRADAETIKQAMVAYEQSPDKDIYRLIDYSRTFKVANEVRHYMEVLL